MLRSLTSLVEWVVSIATAILAVGIVVGCWMFTAVISTVVTVGGLILVAIAMIAGGTKAGLEERRKKQYKQ